MVLYMSLLWMQLDAVRCRRFVVACDRSFSDESGTGCGSNHHDSWSGGGAILRPTPDGAVEEEVSRHSWFVFSCIRSVVQCMFIWPLFEEEDQSLQQPWVWSVSDFIFLATAYDGGWPILSLIVPSSHWQVWHCAVSAASIAELARGRRWNRNFEPNFCPDRC